MQQSRSDLHLPAYFFDASSEKLLTLARCSLLHPLFGLRVDGQGDSCNKAEEGYQRWVKEREKIKWHIYRDEKGVLTWLRPQDDDGTIPGERLDNKKR